MHVRAVWACVTEMFQSAPPAESDPRLGILISDMREFQSAPPCGERLPPPSGRAGLGVVSIRAPLRRATADPVRCGPERRVSIRAPLRRATLPAAFFAQCAPVSIRAPLRRATAPWDCHCIHFAVSIRAPLRRATSSSVSFADPRDVSIRAPLRRATVDVVGFDASVPFQSAPPCGERHRILSRSLRLQDFRQYS